MKNEAKFHETVGILVNAYLNDTLVHKACTACAVGNIVSHHLGGLRLKDESDNTLIGVSNEEWSNGLRAQWWSKIRCPDIENSLGEYQIDATGYTLEQLDSIEYAFENVDEPEVKGMYWCRDDAYMLRGLMAVVDVLAEIHEIDLSVKESVKLLFVK